VKAPNGNATEKAATEKNTSTQYAQVSVEDGDKFPKWIQDASLNLTGDYKEAGVYENKKYFQRNDGTKPRMFIYWSDWYSEWYFGERLGGTSRAWVDADPTLEVPQEKGWLMRGSMSGFHHDTPLKVKMESAMMHEVDVCEHCLCAPFRCIRDAALACCAGSKEPTNRELTGKQTSPKEELPGITLTTGESSTAKASNKKTKQYAHVYLKQNEQKNEKWIDNLSQGITGDYKEAGVHEGLHGTLEIGLVSRASPGRVVIRQRSCLPIKDG